VAGAPAVHANSFRGTLALALNRLPIAFWHIRQWHTLGFSGWA
jgi:hypothetical protein